MLAKGRGNISGWIVACDIDYFKTINDVYGHATGDAVLKEFTDVLQAHLRSRDLTARTGGEEFILYLDDLPSDATFALVETIRQNVKAHEFSRLSNGARLHAALVLSGSAIRMTSGKRWSVPTRFFMPRKRRAVTGLCLKRMFPDCVWRSCGDEGL